MNTIKSMINLLLMFVVAATLWIPFIASAEQGDGYGYTISEVEAHQRWPWERKVDINFVLTPPAGMPADQLVRMSVVASNNTSEVVVSPQSLRGTAVLPGACHMLWDPTVDYSSQFFSSLKFYLSVVSTNVIPEYMVVDLVTGDVVYENDLLAERVNTDLYKTTKMALRYIEPGTFLMGRDTTKAMETTVTKGFYIGVFEVTQAQWKNIKGSYPPDTYFTEARDMRPADSVSYYNIRGSSEGAKWPSSSNVDSDSFLGVLRARTGVDAFDLPLEAQWESACRAGTTTYYNDGNFVAPDDDASQDSSASNQYLTVLGRYRYNGGYMDGATNAPAGTCGPTNGTAIVGSYQPNLLGLYDMHGNLWELCRDRWYHNLLGGDDPVGRNDLTYQNCVRRGGVWLDAASSCSSSYRFYATMSWRQESNGFRVMSQLP